MPCAEPGSITCTAEPGVLAPHAGSYVQPPENARALWQTFGGAADYRIQLPEATEPDEARAE